MLRRNVRLFTAPCEALAYAQFEKELPPTLAGVRPPTELDQFWEVDLKGKAALEQRAFDTAFACKVDQIPGVAPMFESADVAKVATLEFRDKFFTRLANEPDVTVDTMPHLFQLLYHLARECDRGTNVFSEPEFVLGFCVRAVTLATRCGPCDGRCRTLWWSFHMLWTATAQNCTTRSWSPPLAQAARDTFFLPAADCFAGHHHVDKDRSNTIATAMQCLDDVTGTSPEIAALFCTAEFRDRFFIALLQTGAHIPHLDDTPDYTHMYASNALLHIVGAVPTTQRQEVFATPEFRDEVIVPLIETVTWHASRAALKAAVTAIAENEDGALHPTFAGESFKKQLEGLHDCASTQ